MENFDPGGDQWVRQFIFGPPPRNDSAQPLPDLGGFWKGNLQRFQTRSRDSGILNAPFTGRGNDPGENGMDLTPDGL